MTLKLIGGTLAAVGFFFIAGAMGSDCDGKCMENALGMMEILKWMGIGLATMVTGIVIYMKGD